MGLIYYDAMHIISDQKGSVYHGGGYFGFALLAKLMDKFEGKDIVLLWKKGYQPTTDIEQTTYNDPRLKKEFITDYTDISYPDNSVLFLPMLYFVSKPLMEQLRQVKRKNRTLRIVATIHDIRIVSCLKYDKYDRYYKSSLFKFFGSYVKNSIKAKAATHGLLRIHEVVDTIFTVSNYSMQQLVKHTNVQDINWFFQNIDQSCGMEPVDELQERNFVLFVSGNRNVKNFVRTLDAYLDALEKGYTALPMYVTGNKAEIETIVERFLKSEKASETRLDYCRRYVHCLGFVSERQMQWLYAKCRLLLYTSKYEGFGIPACNAILYGTPVLSSNYTSIPEACGAVSVYADPYSKDSICSAVRLLSDESYYSDIRHKTEEYAPILRRLLDFGSDIMAEKLYSYRIDISN